ncbi:hypothetical protein [Frateuria defendens]|uniref:hypothetical protein n=1 Tax=Frateuria defendens TaxID=2219559 RepID=UPI00066FFF0A|nr:hypothetical protein [Frateuria defendens]
MKTQALALTTLAALLFALPGLSRADDKVVHLAFADAVTAATQSGKLDGSVKFYFADAKPAGKVTVVNDNVTTSQRTNAFGKGEASCAWVLQSALIALQNSAKNAGANAVIDIVSNYKHVEYRDNHNYECHVGFLMSGVALKGKLAKVTP